MGKRERKGKQREAENIGKVIKRKNREKQIYERKNKKKQREA